MGLAGRFARSQARSGQFALGFGLPLESAARCLAASVRLFQPVRHPSRRPARKLSLLFPRRRFTLLKNMKAGTTTMKVATGTVSQTVSENYEGRRKIVAV